MTAAPSPARTRAASGAPLTADALRLSALGLAVRLLVVVWGATRFPPSEDGHFYHVVATRIARGLGYTWLWPDGAVSYAAHYPVGYPALLGALYALGGPRPWLGMLANAVLGAAAVWAAHALASRVATRRGALLAGLGVALHPGLVFYVPALMTEGVAAALVAVSALLAVRAAEAPTKGRLAALALALGVATLVRPQTLLLAMPYGFLATPGRVRRRLLGAAVVTAGTLLVCAPWTLRNCRRMHACLLVSANGGWNAFIGSAPGATGTFVPLETLGVPEECATVWDEAGKDACFGAAARRAILRDPLRFLALVPRKLAATFDYAGAAGWYLHSANPEAFPERAKWALGALETVWQRLLVLAALVGSARAPGGRPRARQGLALASAIPLVLRPAWLSHVGLALCLALAGRRVARAPYGVGLATLAGTFVTHALFFGAGRYSLVCFPVIAALAGAACLRDAPARDAT